MNKYLILALFIFFTSLFCHAQIVIDQGDMPVAGDTLRVSVTNLVPSGYQLTGLDTTWNFSALEALSQRVDTFLNVSVTPLEYQFFFVLQGGANLASPRSASFFPGIPVSEGFTFFKKSAGAYEDLGTAFKVEGFPFPAKYDIPDKQYAFPMNPGDSWASVASFGITIPGLIAYSTERNRSSVVDGWGTLITPFGSFQTLRVKSEILQHDSVYIDSLQTGFPFNRIITEYKWLGKNQGIPLLVVSEEGGFSTAVYRDIYRMSAQSLTVYLGNDTAVLKGQPVTLTAIVTGGTPPYQIWWNTLDSGSTLTVTVEETKTYSVIVIDAVQNFGFADIVVSVKYPPGMDEQGKQQLHVFPNPSGGLVTIQIPADRISGSMQVFTPQGSLMASVPVENEANRMTADLSFLAPGVYFLRISSDDQTFFGKFIRK
jgi:hypothetical protein